MIIKATEEDLIVFEVLSNPISCIEIFFHDLDNLGDFSPDQFSKVRKYQIPMVGFDTLFIENPKLSKKENFEIKKGFAERFPIGGRLTGKSLFGIITDSLLSFFHKTFSWGAISSLDAIHVRGVMEKICPALENHSILKTLKPKILRSPQYKINTNNGCLLESVNNNVVGKNPGGQWFQKHIDKNWEEESSFLTDEITSKKLMARSELGMIQILSGMTTFAKNSPMGRIFYDLKNQNKIINLPSYANPTWDEEKEKAAMDEFGGKNSIGFEVQILGKVVEDCNSVYIIDNLREAYLKDKVVKNFEINKESFYRYKDLLILERPSGIDQVLIALDIGEGSAPTEIIVLFRIGEVFTYHYNITTFKMTADEEEEILNYLMQSLKVNVIGIDTTSGGGKAVASKLAVKYPQNVIWVSFNEKISVDFEKDETGKIKTDNNGHYIYKEEFITDWSIQVLKKLLYTKKLRVPQDNKFDKQFANIVSMKSGMRTVYGSKVANHLHQAFQVASIVIWNTEFLNLKPVSTKEFCKTGAWVGKRGE